MRKMIISVFALCAIVFMAAAVPKSGETLEEAPQPAAIISGLCGPSAAPKMTAAVERAVLTSLIVPAAPVEDQNPYAGLALTDGEKELLACMAYNEARGEPFEGQVAVVQVALNRCLHEAFDGSVSDILLAPKQFSVGSTYGDEQMRAVEAALSGDPALDLNTDVVFFSTGKLTCGSYYKTICCHVFRTYE